MPVDVSFHPLDESFINKYYNRAMEDGMGVIDVDGPSQIVRKKQIVDRLSNFFKKDAQQQLSGKPNFHAETVMYQRPYFLTVSNPNEVVEVLKLLEQAQGPEEIFDILHRQAEHADFGFAEAKAQQKVIQIQGLAGLSTIGSLQVQMYDWLDKKAYRYAMTRFVGFMAGRKIKKFRPKRMTAQEEIFFKNELKRKPEDISADIGAGLGLDAATLMMTMYPYWQSKAVGLTDLKAWTEHLFPMIEGPDYLFSRLPTFNFLSKHISTRVRAGTSGGCIRSQNMGQFMDALNSGKNDIVKIFERVGHYSDMATTLVNRLIEVAQYCLQRGFGLIEASGLSLPY